MTLPASPEHELPAEYTEWRPGRQNNQVTITNQVDKDGNFTFFRLAYN
jgi:hypothetical protein